MMTDDSRRNLQGAMTALVTPFQNGEVDWVRLGNLVEHQVSGGIDWLVPCGTTGESPTLLQNERDQILESVVTRANGRCSILAGTGSNNTADTIEKSIRAVSHGADAVMLVTPYYNRPPQEGLYQHFASVAEKIDLPIVLYNVPARTGATISNDVIIRLRKQYPHIVAIKDATGDISRTTELIQQSDIMVLSGDDSLAWPMMAVGAVGVISVISNLCPSLVKSLVAAAQKGLMDEAMQLHRKVHDLAESLGCLGPNPLPIKTAMAMVDLVLEEFRLPLCPLDVDAHAQIERVLRRHELLTPAAI